MSNTQKSKLVNKLNKTEAMRIIKNTFPAETISNEMESKISEETLEIKLFDTDCLYSVSIISAKHQEDLAERWIYSVLRSNGNNGELVWRYVHPVTLTIYKDPSAVDYKTLPFIA